MSVGRLPWYYHILRCVQGSYILPRDHRGISEKLGADLCTRWIYRTSARMVSVHLQSSNCNSVRKYSSSSTNDLNHMPAKANAINGSSNAAYEKALSDLNSLQTNSQVLALASCKNPEVILPSFRCHMRMAGICQSHLDKLNIVHVSGTKGKGSTCAFTESIIRKAGFKTGFYNSPHLISVTERIQLNGAPIEPDKFTRYFRVIYDKLLTRANCENVDMPSYFSFLTLLAFHVFIEERVDCAIVEVGMGGEYDPTNIIEKPIACGISTLDLDHTNVLGNTIEEIAWNKAGIIKAGVPLYTIKHENPNAMRAILGRADERESPVIICSPLSKTSVDLGIQSLAQYTNASLACHLAHCVLGTLQEQEEPKAKLNLDCLPAIYQAGLNECRWPGRCQILEFNDCITFFLDGAHTRKSMENCLDWFKTSSNERESRAQQILMVNVIGDRDKADVIYPLTINHDNFSHVIFTTNQVDTATLNSSNYAVPQMSKDKGLANAKHNAQVWCNLRGGSSDKVIVKSNTYEAIKWLRTIKDPDKSCHVLATGSLHFVGAVTQTVSMISSTI